VQPGQYAVAAERGDEHRDPEPVGLRAQTGGVQEAEGGGDERVGAQVGQLEQLEQRPRRPPHQRRQTGEGEQPLVEL